MVEVWGGVGLINFDVAYSSSNRKSCCYKKILVPLLIVCSKTETYYKPKINYPISLLSDSGLGFYFRSHD